MFPVVGEPQFDPGLQFFRYVHGLHVIARLVHRFAISVVVCVGRVEYISDLHQNMVRRTTVMHRAVDLRAFRVCNDLMFLEAMVS